MSIIDEIRKTATQKGVKVQTHEDNILEGLFNQMFYLEKNIDEEVKFIKQIMTRGLESQERVGLHASALLGSDNDFCLRAQILSLVYKQNQGSNISPGLMRIFEEGNAIHEKWQRLFIRAGYAKAEDCDRTRFCHEYMLSYTPDIVCEIPKFIKNEKIICEIKSVNTYQFKKMVKHASAEKQLQWYMYLEGLRHGFVLCDDKNCQEFKTYIYEYDPHMIERPLDRCEQIKFYYERLFSHGKMVARPSNATNPECKRCKECFMRETCWGMPNGKVKVDEKNKWW